MVACVTCGLGAGLHSVGSTGTPSLSSISGLSAMSIERTKEIQNAAFVLVGEFLFYWSGIESIVTQGIGRLLQLPEPQAEIVLANVTFRDKISMAKTLTHHTYSSAKSDETTIKAAHRLFDTLVAFNSNYRNILVHNLFIPREEGGIDILRVRAKGKYEEPETIWDADFFEERFKEMDQFEVQLESLFADLEKKWIGVMHEVVRKMTTSSPLFASPTDNSLLPGLVSPPPIPPQGSTGSPPLPPNRAEDRESPESQSPKD
jgi:hypothetical protein